jgi:hypothetical protein
MEAVITQQTSPEEAYRKLDEMASKQTELLRKLTKLVGFDLRFDKKLNMNCQMAYF